MRQSFLVFTSLSPYLWKSLILRLEASISGSYVEVDHFVGFIICAVLRVSKVLKLMLTGALSVSYWTRVQINQKSTVVYQGENTFLWVSNEGQSSRSLGSWVVKEDETCKQSENNPNLSTLPLPKGTPLQGPLKRKSRRTLLILAPGLFMRLTCEALGISVVALFLGLCSWRKLMAPIFE